MTFETVWHEPGARTVPVSGFVPRKCKKLRFYPKKLLINSEFGLFVTRLVNFNLKKKENIKIN